MDQEKTGKLIAALRKEKNLTQAELAQQLGITDKAVSKWECGKCLPDAALLHPLCGILGTTVGELLCGERLAQQNGETATEAALVALVKLYERVMCYRHVFFGLLLIAVGSLLPSAPSEESASALVRFVDGMMLGLSTGIKITGILWALYGFAKASGKGAKA